MKKKTIGIAVIAVFLVCLCAVFLLKGMNRNEEAESTAVRESMTGQEGESAVSVSAGAETDAAEAGSVSEEGTESREADAESSNETPDPAEGDKQSEMDAERGAAGMQNTDQNREQEIINQEEYSGSLSPLHVSGTKLVNAAGKTVQLKGLSTHGIGWFPEYVNDSLFRQFRQDFGINVIRLAMYTAENNGYCSGGSQTKLKNLVKDGVEYASDNGLYVIIDWHILSDNNPNMHVTQAKEFFDEMSAAYKNYPNVIYEICNEPNGDTSWQDIKKYAREVIPVIRKNAPDSVIIVGTPTWSQRVDQAAADPLSEYNNIMYALHFYAATHKEDLRNTMVSAIRKGLPVFVTEFGICDASGNGGIDEAQADQWIKTMNSYQVSYAMWNISNKNETSAIIRSGCSKTEHLTEADLSDSGRWFLNMMKGNLQQEDSQEPEKIPETTKAAETAEVPETVKAAENSGTAEVIAEASLINSWTSGDKNYYQYNIKLTNRGKGACSSWTVNIPLDYDGTISQSWGGNMSVQGKTLTISSVDYNGKIEPGQTIENIGVIIEK